LVLDAVINFDETEEGDYPSPKTRIINLCSEYLRAINPDSMCERDGGFIFAVRASMQC